MPDRDEHGPCWPEASIVSAPTLAPHPLHHTHQNHYHVFMDDGEIQFPTGFSLKDIVAWGSFGLVCHDQPSGTVVKSAHDEETQEHIDAERRVYERLHERGGHPGILRYYGVYDDSAIQLQYASNFDLRSFCHKSGAVPGYQRRQWAVQIAKALAFVHQAGVVHGDLTCANVFLDEELNAKVADFSGSSLDRSPLLVGVTASHLHPMYEGSAKGDLFAFGSLLYELETGHMPYDNFTDEEIEERYLKHDFPNTDCMGLIGNVIRGCWEGKYDDGDMIVNDLKGMQNLHPPLLPIVLLIMLPECSPAPQISPLPTQRLLVALVSILVCLAAAGVSRTVMRRRS